LNGGAIPTEIFSRAARSDPGEKLFSAATRPAHFGEWSQVGPVSAPLPDDASRGPKYRSRLILPVKASCLFRSGGIRLMTTAANRLSSLGKMTAKTGFKALSDLRDPFPAW
jgi:hypothetical protein